MNSAATTATYDLLIPANGNGPSHLRGARGLLCGTKTGRKLFTMAGIVPMGGTCGECLAVARQAQARR